MSISVNVCMLVVVKSRKSHVDFSSPHPMGEVIDIIPVKGKIYHATIRY